MEVWSLIIVSAILVEAVTSAIKPLWTQSGNTVPISVLVSMIVGMVISLAGNLDIPGILGLQIEWPILPQLLSGIIISRGSNFVYDLISQVSGKAKQGEQAE